jgi:hypothetical protein
MNKESIKDVLKNMQLSQKESEAVKGGASATLGNTYLTVNRNSISFIDSSCISICLTTSCNPACNITSCSTCVLCATSACDTQCVVKNSW